MCVTAITSVFALQAFGQSSEKPETRFAIIRKDFQRVYGPIKSEGVTGFEEYGSYARAATLVREAFSMVGSEESIAEIQVATFPKGYRYAAHDAFGSLLLTAAYDEKLSGPGDLSLAVSKVRCTQWDFADGTKGGTICYVHKATSGIGPTGSVRWVGEVPEGGVVSVGIGYRNLMGLPGQLIDKYLREYPSNVPENPTWHIDWETKDLEKWAELARTYKDDVTMLQAGAAYLTRYDKRSFGLLDALRQRDDAVAFSRALGGAVEHMTRLVEERKKKAKDADQKGE